MGTPFNIVVVQPPGNTFSAGAFADTADLLRLSLETCGHPCAVRRNEFDPTAVNVVLGDNHLPDPAPLRDHACIVYQLEPLPGQRGWLALTDARLEGLRSARAVWDYSPANVALLAERGLTGVRLLPVGYHPAAEAVPTAEPDIDVLFYGAVNARRKAILDSLSKCCRVKAVFGVYGAKRDALIGRSKVVLNVHHNPAMLMEQPRVSYLLNNRRFVVSEESPDDPYGGSVLTVPYDQLAETCLAYLDDTAGRQRWGAAGYDFLRRRPMAELVRAVLPL